MSYTQASFCNHRSAPVEGPPHADQPLGAQKVANLCNFCAPYLAHHYSGKSSHCRGRQQQERQLGQLLPVMASLCPDVNSNMDSNLAEAVPENH